MATDYECGEVGCELYVTCVALAGTRGAPVEDIAVECERVLTHASAEEIRDLGQCGVAIVLGRNFFDADGGDV